MNIYDRSTEAFKNYTPLPEAEAAHKKWMGAAAVWFIGIFLALGCLIARPGFFLSYGGSLFCVIFIVTLNIFAVPSFKFSDQFLKDMQLFHDYQFVCYKTAAPQIASRNLLTIAALNIIMGNAENARFAYGLVDASLLKPKSMPTYEKVKEYMENAGCHTSDTYSFESLMPTLYRRLKRSKPLEILFVTIEVFAIAAFVIISILHLIILTGSYAADGWIDRWLNA